MSFGRGAGLGRKMLLVSAGDEQAEEADAGDGGNQRKAGGRGTPRAAITVNHHAVCRSARVYRKGPPTGPTRLYQ